MARGRSVGGLAARIYLRVSAMEQDLTRQESIVNEAVAAGYYVAGVYREKASGARVDRPELQRMIRDLQPGDVVIAERIDRISRLPLAEAERLIDSIRQRGARLAVPGVMDLSELAAGATGAARLVLDAVQELLLRLALQGARDEYDDRRWRQRQGIEEAKRRGTYRGRVANVGVHRQIVALRAAGRSIAQTAAAVGCSQSQVKRVWSAEKKRSKAGST